MRILMVEDWDADAALCEAQLQRDGLDFEMRRVDKEEEFREALSHWEPDVVLADWRVPGFPGMRALAVARELRPDVPCVLVSGTIGEEAAIESLTNGATDYVLKDRLSRLAPGIRRALGEAQERRERRRAEAALVESERRFRLIAGHIAEVFWIADRDSGRVTYVSQAFEKVWGLPCDRLLQDPALWITTVHPEDRPRFEEGLSRLKEGRAQEITYRILRPDGAARWIHNRGYPVRDDAGGVRAFVGSAVDITERRQLESQLLQAQKMDAVGRLAGGVAHDFNNLLTVISGCGHLLRERLAELPDLLGQVVEIQHAAARATQLTGQLLAFSRQQRLQPSVLEINATVSNIGGMLRRLIGENIELETVLADDLGRAKADPGQIEQVIVNLVLNARDAMPDGGRISLRTANATLDRAYAETHPEVTPGDYVMIAVTDTGTGIPPDVLAHIFEPFFTTKAPGKGTGLGLATCYGIIKQSGGHISVYSEPGLGSTFKVYLPRTAAGAARPDTGPRPAATKGGSESILLVEDEPAVMRLAATILRKLGYSVLTASDGDEALRLAGKHPDALDLLVTDMVMPQMSGRKLATAMLTVRPGLKVLMTSGYSDDTVVLGKDPPFPASFLSKPYTPDALARKVREVLDAE